MENLATVKYVILYVLCDWFFSSHLFRYILVLLFVLIWNLGLNYFLMQFPYMKCHMSSAFTLLGQYSASIAQVLLIFNCSIAIPIPELQYCIAIQNSKTCSALSSSPQFRINSRPPRPRICNLPTPLFYKSAILLFILPF